MRTILTPFFLLIFIASLGQELTTIKVFVPNKTDEIFITGNQESLGNWNPNIVKMNKSSDYEREISLNLTFPAEFKFTRGNWDSEAKTQNYQYSNIILRKHASDLKYKIEHWKSGKVENDALTLKYEIKYLPSKHYPNEERVLKVFLPKNYDSSKKYPVVYTLDGETLFDLLIRNISVLQDKTFDDNNTK